MYVGPAIQVLINNADATTPGWGCERGEEPN